MRKTTEAVIWIGCLVTLSAWADDSDDMQDIAASQIGSMQISERPASSNTSYSFPLAGNRSVFGYTQLSNDYAWGSPVADSDQLYGGDNPLSFASYWRDVTAIRSEVFTLGYVWRSLKLEGSAYSLREAQREQGKATTPALFSATSGRLSYSPAPNWTLQFSRGYLSSLDQLEPDGEVRRTAISATYKRLFNNGDWRTTLAWGRKAKPFRESTNGYLFESMLRLANAHAVFGRLEQAGNDDLLRENASLQRQTFKMNKLTVGYFYNVSTDGPLEYDIGGMVSRHLVPSGMTPAYGNDPTAFLMFIRFKLR